MQHNPFIKHLSFLSILARLGLTVVLLIGSTIALGAGETRRALASGPMAPLGAAVTVTSTA